MDEADCPSRQCTEISPEGSLAWGNRCILRPGHGGAHVFGTPKYERGTPEKLPEPSATKKIRFRFPHTLYCHPFDCEECKGSCLIDLKSTAWQVFCPYCGEQHEITWE